MKRISRLCFLVCLPLLLAAAPAPDACRCPAVRIRLGAARTVRMKILKQNRLERRLLLRERVAERIRLKRMRRYGPADL